jgi:hypothetical protein
VQSYAELVARGELDVTKKVGDVELTSEPRVPRGRHGERM